MSDKRPIYETQQHRDQELRVAAVIARKWQCLPVKLPMKYSLDFALVRDKQIKSFCEMRARNYTMVQFGNMGGYMLSLAKWTNAQNICKATNVPFILIVQTIDKKIWYSVFKDDFLKVPAIMNMKSNRNDSQDIEPCVLIDTRAFTLLD